VTGNGAHSRQGGVQQIGKARMAKGRALTAKGRARMVDSKARIIDM
jgi:hypothetical protein